MRSLPPLRDWITELRNPDDTVGQIIHDTAITLGVFLILAILLFTISGLWPPIVAIESESMSPNMKTGDLVFVVEENRWTGANSYADTGITTHQVGQSTDYRTFNEYGDVIVYNPNGNARETPVIHRAQFWVEKGEDWHSKADSNHLQARDCEELRMCPAPNDGFITLGDNNRYYDQSNQMQLSSPVQSSWIVGKAKVRVPWFGWPRLLLN